MMHALPGRLNFGLGMRLNLEQLVLINYNCIILLQLVMWHILGAEVQLTFGSGSGPVHFNNVVCNGSQPRLIDCQTSTGRCYYNIAGVNCGFDTLRKSEVLLVTTMSLISCSKHSPAYKV